MLSEPANLDDRTRWLLGSTADLRFKVRRDRVPVTMPAEGHERQFEQGEYYILGRDIGTGDEVRVIADAGPVGYLRIAAHGHADALSFVLSKGGREWWVNPGTSPFKVTKTQPAAPRQP